MTPWGTRPTAVNCASRLEQACEPTRINISSSTLHYVEELFDTEARGSIELKGLGAIDMYYLKRIKPELSVHADGVVPNDAFWQNARVGSPRAAL